MANRTVGKCARGVRIALAQFGVHEQSCGNVRVFLPT
jgi:hypothetical protein